MISSIFLGLSHSSEVNAAQTNDESIYLGEVGSFNDGLTGLALDIDGDLLCMASGEDGLSIFNIEDEYGIERISEFSTVGVCHDSKFYGNILFTAEYTDGLGVYDVTDLNSPVLIGHIDVGSGQFEKLFIYGDLLFAAAGNYGLRAYDITNPSSPLLIDVYPSNGVHDLLVSGNLAYISTSNLGLLVLNISEPNDINLVNSLSDSNFNPNKLAIDGDVLFCTDYSNYQVSLIDITDPFQIEIINRINTEYNPRCIGVWDDCLYIGTSGYGLMGFEISDPSNPYNYNFPSSYPDNYLTSNDLMIVDELLFIADGSFGLHVIQIAMQTKFPDPTFSSGFDFTSSFEDLFIKGDIAFLALGNTGFSVLNISNPIGTYIIDSVSSIGNVEYVEASGNLLYTAGTGGYLHIFNISDYTSISSLGSIPLTGQIGSLEVFGNTLFVCAGNEGLKCYNVSDPTNISLISTYVYNGANICSDIEIYGDLVYLAYGQSGIVIINISDLNNIVTEQTDSSGYCFSTIERNGNYLFCNHEEGIYLLDISDHDNIQYLEDETSPTTINDISISGDYLYAATSTNVRIFDASNPEYFHESFDSIPVQSASEVIIRGGYMYTLSSDSGLYAHKIKDWGLDDNDNDGLTFNEEIMIYNTDPQNNDSDNDGYSDGQDAYPNDSSRYEPDIELPNELIKYIAIGVVAVIFLLIIVKAVKGKKTGPNVSKKYKNEPKLK